MIIQSYKNDFAEYEYHYAVDELGKNTPYLVLASVQFICHICDKGAYVDMLEVPSHDVTITCISCETDLFLVKEEDFECPLEAINTKKFHKTK